MNECSETECREENFDDHDEIFCLESEFRVRRVQIAFTLFAVLWLVAGADLL